MTDEERAEKYTDSINTIIYDIDDNAINIAKYLRKAYLDGLAKGRKDDKQLKYIEYLVKENKDLQHRLDVAQGFLDRDVEYIEICKAVKENAELSNSVTELTNTKTELENKVTELEAQIEKMKNVGNCKHAMQCPDWVEHKIKDDGIKPCLNCIKWELLK